MKGCSKNEHPFIGLAVSLSRLLLYHSNPQPFSLSFTYLTLASYSSSVVRCTYFHNGKKSYCYGKYPPNR